MLKITSKTLMADKTNPRINDYDRDMIQELLGNPPFAPQKRRHDSGEVRKTTFELGPGMGSQDRNNSVDGFNEPYEYNETTDPRVPSSWYNKDEDAQVNDETKPGHGSIMPAPDGSRSNPYFTQDFLIENGPFVNNALHGHDTPQSRQQQIQQSLERLLNSKPVRNLRYRVDRF